jgi:hypothetical protein
MATPQRNVSQPPPPKQPFDDVADRSIERAVGSGGWFGGIWIWGLIAFIVIGAFWFVGWGMGGYGGWLWGSHPQVVAIRPEGSASANQPGNNVQEPNMTQNGQGVNAAANGPAAGTGAAVLISGNKAPFVGQTLQVRDVPVDKVVGPRTLWIGKDQNTPTLVVLRGADNHTSNAGLHAGDHVDVIGTVARAPSVSEIVTELPQIGRADAKRLADEGAYVVATQVITTK